MRHNEKSENIARGRRLLVVASQTVGVVAVHRPHRRPNPFISGQSFHFQKTGALGDTMLIPLSLTVRAKIGLPVRWPPMKVILVVPLHNPVAVRNKQM